MRPHGSSARARAKIARVREGFEGDIYTLAEAKSRIAELEKVVSRAEGELRRPEKQSAPVRRSGAQAESLRQELRRLRDRNLDDATFDQRVDLISRLGIAVYPSEDLAAAKVTCLLGSAATPVPPDPDRTTNVLEARTEAAGEGAEVTFTPPIMTTPYRAVETSPRDPRRPRPRCSAIAPTLHDAAAGRVTLAPALAGEAVPPSRAIRVMDTRSHRR